MELTEWIQIKNECFEECRVVMDNGEDLITIKRWDTDTKDGNCKRMVTQPCGNIRVTSNGLELFFTPHHISRANLQRRANDYLSLPFSDFKNILGFKTPEILGLLPKKFKSELKEFLNGSTS